MPLYLVMQLNGASVHIKCSEISYPYVVFLLISYSLTERLPLHGSFPHLKSHVTVDLVLFKGHKGHSAMPNFVKLSLSFSLL